MCGSAGCGGWSVSSGASMRRLTGTIVTMLIWAVGSCLAAEAPEPSASVKLDNLDAAVQAQFDTVRPVTESLLAVQFKLAKGWHAYADASTAPGGMSLKLKYHGQGVSFGEPVYPIAVDYFDPSADEHLKAYEGDFAVYLPFTVDQSWNLAPVTIEIEFKGAFCTDQLCTIKEGKLTRTVNVSRDAAMEEPAFKMVKQVAASPGKAAEGGASPRTILPLAIVAGLLLNIMPCIWPVLPVVVMRLVTSAGRKRAQSLLLGFAFSTGILLFFLVFAVVNVVLRMGFGTTFSFVDLSQNADYLVFMSLLLVVMALFMFGVFNVGIPASLTGRSGGGSGIIGSVGMGFLAAILATPCSFGILVAVLAWAQTQPVPLASLTIMLIGVGMALPYLALTAIPGLVNRLPRPGKWMDIFKQAVGYLLLVIAVKQIAGLPQERLVPLLYYIPVLAFAVWMWGSWVDYSTPRRRKWTVRLAALVIAVAAGWMLLPSTAHDKGLIKWQPYDAAKIEQAVKTGQPVLVDFIAAWCLNCTVLDRVVYTRRDIAELVQARNVLPVRADVTLAEYPASAALKVLGESAIPLNVLYIPGKQQPHRFHGIWIGSELKGVLESLPAPAPAPTPSPAAAPAGDANSK
jgi:thiol:disulfide interchange protein